MNIIYFSPYSKMSNSELLNLALKEIQNYNNIVKENEDECNISSHTLDYIIKEIKSRNLKLDKFTLGNIILHD